MRKVHLYAIKSIRKQQKFLIVLLNMFVVSSRQDGYFFWRCSVFFVVSNFLLQFISRQGLYSRIFNYPLLACVSVRVLFGTFQK
jgi:hypothetical protein